MNVPGKVVMILGAAIGQAVARAIAAAGARVFAAAREMAPSEMFTAPQTELAMRGPGKVRPDSSVHFRCKKI